MRSATPRQSKPGPRLEVLAGTRTVICSIGEPRRTGRAREDALRCGSVATRAKAATDPLRDADSKYAVGDDRRNEFWVDCSGATSRFSGRGNGLPPTLHDGGWLRGTLRTRRPHLVHKSADPRATSHRIAIVGQLCRIPVPTHFRKVCPSKK